MSDRELEGTLRVRVPTSVLERLDARAAAAHRTRSQQLRFWLEAWLDYEDAADAAEAEPGAPPPPPRKRGKRR